MVRTLLCQLCLLTLVSTARSEAPPTIAQALQQRHIEITPPALLEALHNPDKTVRGLAAAELAELKIDSALPEIIRAAHSEADPLTQVNIAAAATWLRSEDGLHLLTAICADANKPAFIRIDAARNAFDRHDHTCFPALVELMRSSPDQDTIIGVISLTSQLKPLTAEEAQIVVGWASTALHDPDTGIRLAAVDVFRWTKDPRGLAPLRAALPGEREEIVRSEIQYVLNMLEPSTPPATH